jgi:hypothetical protein
MSSSRKLSLFNDDWLNLAFSRQGGTEWVDDVVRQLDNSGGIYLNTLRVWFQRFPLSNKQKKHLKQRIESFNNSDHLGGVNELSWWEFMRSFHWPASPIPAGSGSLPDFHITSPYEFFCEVTTLNKSEYEKRKISEREWLSLDHSHSIGRILAKVIDEKYEQIRYGHSKNKPSVLILFDYTFWSGFGTQFYRALANFLLGNTLDFAGLPSELSAVVYVERKVLDGRIGISKQRSAVYHNPNSRYKLPGTVFTMMRQYLSPNRELQPTDTANESSPWLWLKPESTC